MNAKNDEHQYYRWRSFSSRAEFDRAARDYILDAAASSIDEHGRFRLVLSGGKTPRRIYESLQFAETDWSAWHIYFGDERCLPRDDPARNSLMAAEAWLDHVPIPPEQIHVIPAELGPERGAERYRLDLEAVSNFDLVLLGLGPDGHTASLFPGGDWESASSWPDAIPVHNAPKPPPERVSLSPARLSSTRHCLFLIAGSDKADAVGLWREGIVSPAKRILANEGVDAFLDLQEGATPESSWHPLEQEPDYVSSNRPHDSR